MVRFCFYCSKTGEEVSLSIENDLLALVAYRGLGNTTADSEDSSDVYVHWPSGTATKKPPPNNQTPIESAGNEERHSTRAAERESSGENIPSLLAFAYIRFIL